MNLNGHGGDINNICITYGLNPDEIIDFSASINPLGYPDSVRRSILERFNDIIHYPDSKCTKLRKVIAEKHYCKEENIIIGNGSNELFHLIPRAIKPKNGAVLHPTFSEFKDALYNSDVKFIEIINNSRSLRFNLNDLKLKSLKEGIVFICNPNNPTGQLVTREEILEFARDCLDRIIVVDEAFMDFVEDEEKYSVIKDVVATKNIIVVRSLTKFYGFPGLRLGYLAACESVINILLRFKEPWTVNAFAQIAGQAAINDNEFALNSKRFMSTEKIFLYEGLSNIKELYPLYPSANFILIRIGNAHLKSSEIHDLLIKDRIVIRDCSNFIGLSDKFFRVAVRTRHENENLLKALRRIMTHQTAEIKDKRYHNISVRL